MKLKTENWRLEIRPRLSRFRLQVSGFRFQVFTLLMSLLAAGCLAAEAGRAATAAAGNPYQTIVTRNVFGLGSIPTGPAANADPEKPLPKITPNGIMRIFGKLQVLFKVAVPGQPAGKEDSYVMSEGDRQDEIEVQKIDEKAAIITFDNHGFIQTLPLVAGKASGGAVPPPAASGVPQLPAMSGASIPPGFAPSSRLGRSHGAANATSAGANSGDSLGTTSSSANTQNQEKPLEPEEQVIMIEANRMLTQDQVNKGEMPPLPVTELTPSDATGIGGGPLVVGPNGNPAVPNPDNGGD